MKKTNLKSTSRLLGKKSGFCYRDTLYSKALLIFALFLLPAMIFAQGNKQEQLKEKEALNQAYLDAKHGNKPGEMQAGTITTISKEEVLEQQELEFLLGKFNVNKDKMISLGFSDAEILSQLRQELLDLELSDLENPKSRSNSIPDLYARQGSADCSAAVSLTCNDVAIAGSTIGFGATDFINCGGGGSAGVGVWYRVIGDGYANTVSVTGSGGFLPRVHVYSSGGDCSSIQCAGGTSGQGTASAGFLAAFEDIFYIYVTGGGTAQGGYHITLTTTNPNGCEAYVGDGLSSATALLIACGDVDNGDTTGTSSIPGHESGPSCNGTAANNGVWYKFNTDASFPAGTGATVELCGSSYDTELHIYEGAALDCVDSNDDSCGLQSSVSFDALPGVDYYIYVGAFSTSSGAGAYQIAVICDGIQPPPPPQVPNNDLCPDSAELTCNVTLTGQSTFAASGATTSSCVGSIGDDVWYTIAGTDGPISITVNAGFDDAQIEVYEAVDSCTDFTLGNCSFSAGGFDSPSVVGFPSVLGTLYYIRVGNAISSAGGFNFSITAACTEPITNDDCDDAIEAFCGDIISSTTIGATSSGVPTCVTSLSTAPGLWYSHTGTGELLTISLCGSTYDTKIGVFTEDCNNLVCVTGNDDSCGLQSEVNFGTVIGEEYLIYVTGFSTASGAFTMELTCQPDPCQEARPIVCGDTATGTTLGGSTAGPTSFCGTSPGSTGVYYVFEGNDEFVTASLCNSSYDTKINIYSGSCGSLTCLTGNDDSCGSRSEADFFAAAGTDYYIWVSGFGTSTGNYELTMTCRQPAENDLCDSALALGCDVTIAGSTELSTDRDAPEGPCGDFGDPNAGVWYTIQGTGGDINVSLCGGASFDTTLSILTGSCELDTLTCIDGNDDSCGVQSEVEFASLFGETYYIYVSGFGSSRGDFNLTIDCLCVPTQTTECVTVYEGFDPASTDVLTANLEYANDPVTYLWSTGETTQSITVDAADGTQNITVFMSDADGCSGTQEFFVYVVDVDCDRSANADKTELCHNGTTICVANNAVQSHLNHGDTLGACGTELCDELLPFCDNVVSSPANGAIDVSNSPTIQWSSASGVVDGYRISIGTTSGGTDVVNNEDVFNVLSYLVLVDLDFETLYYVSVIPYNTVGSAQGCSESSFTTREDPVPNDLCTGAINLTVNSASGCEVTYTVDHLEATDSEAGFTCDVFDNIDSWYTFIAPSGGAVELSTVNGTQSGTPGWVLYDSCDGTQIFCANNTSTQQVVTGLTPGAEYTMAVFYDTFQTEGTFTICIGTPPPPPVNDTCDGAVSLTVNPDDQCGVTYEADHTSAIDEELFSCDGFGNIGTWYTFIAPSAGAINMSTTQGTQPGSPGWAIFDSCNGTEVFCANNTFAAQTVSGLTPGAEYTMAVWFDSGFGTFTICLGTPPPPPGGEVICGTPLNQTYCYGDNDNSQFLYTSDDGSALQVVFNSGTIESCCDDITIYDGTSTLDPVLFSGTNGGNFAGLTVGGTSDSLLIVVDSDSSISCGSGSRTEWDFDVACYTPVEASCNDMTVNINTGSFGSEVSWNLLDSGNVSVASGSGYSSSSNYAIGVSLPDGNYTFEMIDSWGDGWNGGTFSVVNGDGATIASGGLSSGSFGTVPFTADCLNSVPPSCNDMTVNINTASFGSEVSWNLLDSGNTSVASGSGYSSSSNYAIGVTLPNGSYTFEMIDSWGDGWNGGTFSVVDGTGGTIASGGLISGSFGTVPFTANCSGGRLANPELAWSMSPNPSRGQVRLGLEDFVNNDVTVMVLNLAGNVVFNRTVRDLQNANLDIELRNVPYGMYFVRIISNDTVSTKKLIINN